MNQSIYFFTSALKLTKPLNPLSKHFLYWYANKFNNYRCNHFCFHCSQELLELINEFVVEQLSSSSITHRGQLRYQTKTMIKTITDCLFDDFVYSSFKQNLKLVYKNHCARIRQLTRLGYQTINTIPLKQIKNIDAELYHKHFHQPLPSNVFIADFKTAEDGFVLTLQHYENIFNNSYNEEYLFITHRSLCVGEEVLFNVASLF